MPINSLKLFPVNKVLIAILAIVVIAVLILFIALSFFDYPSADDFCYAAKAKQLGFIEAQVFWYQHWSGRYTLNLVYTAFTLSGDIFKIYRFPPIILLVSTWLGFAFLTAKIAQSKLSIPLVFLLGGYARYCSSPALQMLPRPSIGRAAALLTKYPMSSLFFCWAC
ncbi:MAG: hypothetical protein IPL99_06780 [Candidatus Competibacteraceae bacterium]|nr:hypothetical protein [Candidatus Competibacteraceae bacterium]